MVNGNANTLNVLTCLSNLQNARPEKSLIPHPELVTFKITIQLNVHLQVRKLASVLLQTVLMKPLVVPSCIAKTFILNEQIKITML